MGSWHRVSRSCPVCTWTHYIAKDELELLSPLTCRGYRCVPPHLDFPGVLVFVMVAIENESSPLTSYSANSLSLMGEATDLCVWVCILLLCWRCLSDLRIFLVEHYCLLSVDSFFFFFWSLRQILYWLAIERMHTLLQITRLLKQSVKLISFLPSFFFSFLRQIFTM